MMSGQPMERPSNVIAYCIANVYFLCVGNLPSFAIM